MTGIIAAGLVASVVGTCGKPREERPGAPVVRVVVAQPRLFQRRQDFLATLDGSTNAEIRPQVSGTVESVAYSEGGVVGIGTLLFTIDKRPFVAALTRAQGDHDNAIAQLNKAKADVARFTPLVAEGAVSRQDLENAQAATAAAAGLVQSTRGALAAARLNLSWTEVRSPIEGLAGIAQTRVGNLVGPSQVLTVVSTLDPIRASIHISERDYLKYAERLNDPHNPRYADHEVLQLILVDGSVYPHTARSVIVGRQIDSSTGTLVVQALFPNPGNILRPGMFATLRIFGGTAEALMVPERAVEQLQGQHQVRIVNVAGRVELRAIVVGELIEHEYAVESGLRAGERVIVEGLEKAQPGTIVTAEPAPAPVPVPASPQEHEGPPVNEATPPPHPVPDSRPRY